MGRVGSVLVAPLRYGAGLKGKIALALARGLPVVTTTVGAEGLRLVNGINAVVADDVADIARGCAELLSDRALWKRMSTAGHATAQQRVAPERLVAVVTTVLSLV
jgi:glycosyltransferase involved in cell wall biosynthesis